MKVRLVSIDVVAPKSNKFLAYSKNAIAISKNFNTAIREGSF